MTDSPIFSDHSINTEDLNFSVAIVHSQPNKLQSLTAFQPAHM